jgi:flagellar protein FliS
MRHGYNDYQKARVVTGDSGELLLMLFDGAVRFTQQAIAGMIEGDVPRKCEGISRAFAIVSELHGTLDFEVSEELAGNLASLYIFILENFSKANIYGEVQPLRDIVTVLETLREGWVGAIEEVRKNQAGMTKDGRQPVDASSLSVIAG